MRHDRPDDTPPPDQLLERYREANALDPARPGPALRETVLAHARSVADARAPAPEPITRVAANDSVWSWKAVASLAVVGLVGLLVLQFDRGTPEEKEAAFGTAMQRSAPTASAPAAPATPAAGIAPAQDAASEPAAANAPAASAKAPVEAVPAVTPPVVQAPARPAPKPTAADSAQRATVQDASPIGNVDGAHSASKMAPAQEAEAALAPPPAPNAPPAPAAAPAPMAAAKPAAIAPAAPASVPALVPPPVPALAEGTGAGATAGASGRSPVRERRENSTADAVSAPLTYPLHTAAAAGDAITVRQWITRGANPNQRDEKGRTPLMLAAARGDGAVARLLVEAGADRSLRDPQGLSAADLAERAGHPELLPLLR